MEVVVVVDVVVVLIAAILYSVELKRRYPDHHGGVSRAHLLVSNWELSGCLFGWLIRAKAYTAGITNEPAVVHELQCVVQMIVL